VGQKARTRLFAGEVDGRALAFVEIELAPGWKTYWRNPGDAGGLPPSFDWAKSQNLAEATVLYPAPIRMRDKAGDTIGYKSHVIFPVELKRQADGGALSLELDAQYGICKDVCIPVEASLKLEVPPGKLEAAGAAALSSLAAVPRAQEKLTASDPVLVKAECVLRPDRPHVAIEAQFAESGDGAEVYLDVPGGIFIPHPVKTGDLGGGKLQFEAKLGVDVDVDALRGRTITATLVGAGGASSATCQAN
jgi:DsbC/DsbD-like thiol-disulfide interchange protein